VPDPAVELVNAARTVDWARAVLAAEEAAGLLRAPRERRDGSGARSRVGGRAVVVLSSNDYLGLADHPHVRRAAADAALALGVGATGSRHLSGCHRDIASLESELSAFEGAAAATLAPSGYQANVAVLQALGGSDAVVLSDERNHASIIDGCKLSRSDVEVYRHADLDDLRQRLRRARRRPIVVSDTVFSMDGDVADVAGLLQVAREHDAWLVLDEAHATGVLGPGGRGAAAEAGADARDERLVRVVTLSKALGAAGGAILSSATVRQLLLQRGRALIFSTALPHPVVAAARAALAILAAEPERCQRVRDLACRLRAGLRPLVAHGRADVPIVPVVVGDPSRAVVLERRLLEAGYLVQAVRPPTVAPGTSRLRIVPTAAHTEAEIDGAASAVRAALGTVA
jgi:8-amino-7-oxononanoate synthase